MDRITFIAIWSKAVKFLWRIAPDRRMIPHKADRRIRDGRKSWLWFITMNRTEIHDLALVGLALVVFGIIAAAVPCLKVCVDGLFGLFQ